MTLWRGQKIFLKCKMSDILARNLTYDGWYHPPSNKKTKIQENVTALVLGWAGSHQKNVQKFTQMYSNELGIGAHGYIMPMELCFNYDQPGQRQLAEHLVEKVLIEQNTGQRILIHCFSNNGFNFYKHVSLVLKDQPNE